MGLAELFSWSTGQGSQSSDSLPDIFPLGLAQEKFIETDIVAIYSKILTDVLERTHGLTDDQTLLLWDNCVKSSSQDGLISLLSKAMADKKELFLIYDKAVKVIRIANNDEAKQIREDYENRADSKLGIFISFKNFHRSDMIKFYLGFEYCTVASLYKSMNLSKAVQLKINDLRGSVSMTDSSVAKAQAQTIATALKNGKDVLLDAKDVIETVMPELSAVEEANKYLVQKLSFYLGLPDSYIVGEQTSGMGTTGENDMRAVERGLKSYFFSIFKPVLESLFGGNVSYKSQDFRNLTGTLEALKTFSLVDDSLVSSENKLKIINQLLDFPEDTKGDEPEDEPPQEDPENTPPVAPGNNPPDNDQQ